MALLVKLSATEMKIFLSASNFVTLVHSPSGPRVSFIKILVFFFSGNVVNAVHHARSINREIRMAQV